MQHKVHEADSQTRPGVTNRAAGYAKRLVWHHSQSSQIALTAAPQHAEQNMPIQ
jgi:hypothetical protein